MVINFNKARTAPLAAEFLGTGVLVMVALVLSQTTGVPYFIATSVAVTPALPVKSSSWSSTAWLAEVVGTAILAVGLTAALTRRLDTLTTALTYGASFFAGIMVAATASAAYLNPASALALRNFNAVYILGPLVGGIIGVGLYTWFFAPAKGKK